MAERVSFESMLLARVPIGIDMPVPMSLPGRAPVAGSVPGGTPCGAIGADVWANAGVQARPARTVKDSARERMRALLCYWGLWGIGYEAGLLQLWQAVRRAMTSR
jgi:hypothetical protein